MLSRRKLALFCVGILLGLLLVVSGLPYAGYLTLRNKGLAKLHLVHPDDAVKASWLPSFRRINFAIWLANPGGEVLLDTATTATVAINMKANVNVRCLAKNVIITFTGATDGFVWPGTALDSGLYGCTLKAGNSSSGKAINISDVANGAFDVTVQDVHLNSTNPPTTKWAYGIYLSNAQRNHFDRVHIENTTIAIHGDGISNSESFTDMDITNNMNTAVLVEWQGGTAQFNGGEIEGTISTALVDISTSATAVITFNGTQFENASTTGIGVRANTGAFECYGCAFVIDSAAGATGFVIGNSATTKNCKIYGGQGTAWTLGANATFNTISGYRYSGPAPSDSSPSFTNYLNNNVASSTSFLSSVIPEKMFFGGNVDLNSGSIFNVFAITRSANATTNGALVFSQNNSLPALQFQTNVGAVSLQLRNTGSWQFDQLVNQTLMGTTTNCSSPGGTCAAAPAGSVSIAAAATTVTVATTAVTANSQILLTRDDSLGTKLSVTCNTQSSLVLGTPRVTTRTAATSFVITIDVGPTTNPMCISYSIVN